jgi:hypothetical protein
LYVARFFEGDVHRICTSRVFLKAVYIGFARRAYFQGDVHHLCTSRVFLKAMYIAFVRRAYF